MGDERGRYLDAAHEFLQELERPGASEMLEISRTTPSSEIQNRFVRALANRSRTGLSMPDLAQARGQLMDTQKRLELDTQTLDNDEWLRELERLRNYYALFDFLEGLRKQ